MSLSTRPRLTQLPRLTQRPRLSHPPRMAQPPRLSQAPRLTQRLRDVYTRTCLRAGGVWADDSGMSTVEYAIGTIGAAAFGAVLIAVVKSDGVQQALLNIIQQALTIQ